MSPRPSLIEAALSDGAISALRGTCAPKVGDAPVRASTSPFDRRKRLRSPNIASKSTIH